MNRKEQIASLEAEIAQKNQTLNQLKEADEKENQDIDPTQEDVDGFVDGFFNKI